MQCARWEKCIIHDCLIVPHFFFSAFISLHIYQSNAVAQPMRTFIHCMLQTIMSFFYCNELSTRSMTSKYIAFVQGVCAVCVCDVCV